MVAVEWLGYALSSFSSEAKFQTPLKLSDSILNVPWNFSFRAIDVTYKAAEMRSLARWISTHVLQIKGLQGSQ